METSPDIVAVLAGDAGAAAQHLAGQVGAGAIAVRGVTEAARPGRGQLDQFADIVRGHLGVDHDHAGRLGHQGDRGEALLRVIAQVLVEPRVDGERGVGGHQQRVAVRPGAGHEVRAGDRGGAGLHHHRLAQALAQFLADDARHQVGHAARGIRHDQADGLARVVGACRAGGGGRGAEGKRCCKNCGQLGGIEAHGLSPV